MHPSDLDPDALAAGASAAVDEYRRRDAEAAPAQGSLFGSDPIEADGIGELAPEHRGPGRPAGSRNKSTEDWSRFILSRYRSPLLGLAEIAQATPGQLQAELGGKPDSEGKGGVSLERCLAIIIQAQQALAPYLHQKQPTAIDAGGAGLFTLVIESGNGSEAVGGVQILEHEESEQNQSVSVTDFARLEAEGRKE